MKGKESKPHIGILGRRNNGKSSLINSLAGQEIAIVSDVAGTTTDPVKKSMEITGLGPVILIDTAGIDDIGELGEKRINKTLEALKTIDLAILVICDNEFGDSELNLIEQFNEFIVPFFVVHNKSDLSKSDPELAELVRKNYSTEIIEYNNINPDKEKLVVAIRKYMPTSAYKSNTLVGDLISYGDVVLLITPIDIEAPEGRLILPQVQVIRDILDNDGVAIVLKEREVDSYIRRMEPKPALVITDSQVFLKADASIPKDIPLTSFSIVLARQKGDFEHYIQGTPEIGKLKNGDRILILESCTHHVSCDDIGRVKIPRWLSNYTGKELIFDTVSGFDSLPVSIHDYALVIQCGGCVLTKKQVISRLKPAIDAGIPVTNYGMAIAYAHGIFERAVRPFVKLVASEEQYL
ncbi:MAG: [FeFe] hydrogenase H-cluster maturation GTPase HydF [Bacteroidetes bacterium]|nr:[FeFe] hydrogenase H-cluster maturation GTPase HydF [Bacteroidota bacterium]